MPWKTKLSNGCGLVISNGNLFDPLLRVSGLLWLRKSLQRWKLGFILEDILIINFSNIIISPVVVSDGELFVSVVWFCNILRCDLRWKTVLRIFHCIRPSVTLCDSVTTVTQGCFYSINSIVNNSHSSWLMCQAKVRSLLTLCREIFDQSSFRGLNLQKWNKKTEPEGNRERQTKDQVSKTAHWGWA